MALEPVKVWVVTEDQPKTYSCSSTFTAEELCILLCKKCNIPPLTRTLFGLRVKGTNYFLKDNSLVLCNTREYELRIRFKVPRLGHLITLDETTYDYYFRQARNDCNENRIPEVQYPDHKKELLGLGITDMYRAILEEKLTINEVERNYKKYIPKVILKRHGPFPKKYAHNLLPRMCASKAGCDVNYVKSQYLQQLNLLAPNYLAEEYRDVTVQNGKEIIPAHVQVAPFHPQQPGLRVYNALKGEWSHMCTIEEIVYLTRNGDNGIEVSRRGTPIFLKFKSEKELSSFISVCDGYYRLMVKWTFNLSKDDETPSLKELHRIKCHGPVGGAFSYRKLEEKRAKKHGCYILRQCQDDYNIYYLDVCTKSSTTETYRLEFKGHCYVFNQEEYFSIEKLVSSYKNPEGRIYLNECIPPSEYDKSQLLLCGEPLKKGIRIDQAELQEILKDNKSPRCLNTKDILLYTGSEKIGSGGITATHKALWKLEETKKLEVAFKTLHKDKANDCLKDFIDLASKWACVHSSSIVRLYGVTLSSPTALVLEYIPYGPFDDYLRNHEDKIKAIHLKKVAASLARALWDLSEAGVVHGYLRCRRLLLARHEDDRIVVKLTGPSLHAYTNQDVHWIPVEYFSDMSLARRSVAGDIWAFATTLWEIFSYGQSPNDTNPVLTAKSYSLGSRLLRPSRCESEVWALARQCWSADPHLRPKPQQMMRDMNRLLHTEYLPIHDYEEPKISLDHREHEETISSDRFTSELSDAGSNKSLLSVSIPSINGTMSDPYYNFFNKSSNSLDSLSGECAAFFNGPCSRAESPSDLEYLAPRRMECFTSEGKAYLVTFNKHIGQGTYGHVYQGWMEQDKAESARREVAVKQLMRQDSIYEDFKNELDIMKTLKHENIVEILGYSWHGGGGGGGDVLIVMEYFEQGSLNDFLRYRRDTLDTHHLIKYSLDIANGMHHVSSNNVVHRDLATRNILVVNKNHVKISDFGLARIIPKEETAYKIKTERLLPFNWYAPESAVKPWHFSTKSDVWSFGVTVWEIFTHAKLPVPTFDLEAPEKRASCFQIPENCPSEVYRCLMKDCWELEPNKRPKFIDLVHICKRLYAEQV